MQILPYTRQRPSRRSPLWIIVLISMVCISLMGAYVYPPRRYAACYFFATCSPFTPWLPPRPIRVFTDDEIAARMVFKDILKMTPVESQNPKIAFMFLTPEELPFEKLWEKFFLGHEDRYSIYVHASRRKPDHESPLFFNRDIRSDKVHWGKISMIDAERRLLANALQDPDNRHFILLSDSCIPLHNFDYVYNYLMYTNISFIDSFEDPGPHGTGRYSEHMLPEIEEEDWRKGAQWFSVKRQHALIILGDSLYYNKFKQYCKKQWLICMISMMFGRSWKALSTWASMLEQVIRQQQPIHKQIWRRKDAAGDTKDTTKGSSNSGRFAQGWPGRNKRGKAHRPGGLISGPISGPISPFIRPNYGGHSIGKGHQRDEFFGLFVLSLEISLMDTHAGNLHFFFWPKCAKALDCHNLAVNPTTRLW